MRDAARRLARPKATATATATTGIPASSFFELVYHRPPDAADADLLERLVGAEVTSASEARAVIAGYDHQRLPTPFVVRLTEEDLVDVSLPGFALWVDRRDPSVSAVIKDRRDWEPHLSSVLHDVLRPGDTFVDVGANVGFHTFLASTIVGPGGVVHAFEPNPENCRLLWLSKRWNGAENVEIHPFALDRTPGLRYLVTHLGSNGGLLRDEEAAVRSGLGTFVAAQRLDDAVPGDARLLKVDVEGAEFAVLEGATEVLARCRPHLVLEFSAEMTERVSDVDPFDALERCLALGYGLEVLDRTEPGRRHGVAVDELRASWGDALRIEDLLLTPLA